MMNLTMILTMLRFARCSDEPNKMDAFFFFFFFWNCLIPVAVRYSSITKRTRFRLRYNAKGLGLCDDVWDAKFNTFLQDGNTVVDLEWCRRELAFRLL